MATQETEDIDVKLKQLWLVLNDNIDPAIREKWWETISSSYGEGGRKFHDLTSVARMFIHLDESEKEVKSAQAVSYSIFFHNLFYDPKASDCEEKCAELFCEFAKDAKIEKNDVVFKEVSDLISLTKSHFTEEHTSETTFGSDDKHYFLDFDMSYLGSKPDDYTSYVSRIREEYKFMPDDSYKALRLKVLKSLLIMPKIFSTKMFNDKYESQARDNIKQEISSLEAS